MRKSNGKRVRRNENNGRNVYGQRCVAKFVKLEKNTALDQYLDILADLEASKGKNVEYTVDSSCFSREEVIEFNKKLCRIMALRANLRGSSFVTADISMAKFSA